MNRAFFIGRCVADPEIRYTQGENQTVIARYRLAVDRRFKREGEPSSDFIQCVAFGRQGEFAEKHLHKGTKIAVVGRIQTGSYTNKEGQKVYTTDVVVEEHYFCESKGSGAVNASPHENSPERYSEEFMNIPDDIEDEGLPFS